MGDPRLGDLGRGGRHLDRFAVSHELRRDRGADGTVPGIEASSVATAPLPEGALPGGPGGAFSGAALRAGGHGLLVTSELISPALLVAALQVRGCTVATLAIVAEGVWRRYVPGAPAAVNASFPATIPGGTPFYTRCRS